MDQLLMERTDCQAEPSYRCVKTMTSVTIEATISMNVSNLIRGFKGMIGKLRRPPSLSSLFGGNLQGMLCYVSFDGDGIGQLVGRARLADDVEEVRKVNQRIDLGNEIWKSYALRVGGSIVEIGGDEGALEIPADHLDELPAIARQYAEAVGATVSVGVGTRLSESAKALLHAKLTGKDKIDFYTDDMEGVIAQAEKHTGTEAEKLADEYLNKADPAMNPGAAAGFSGATHPSAPTVAKPMGPQGEHSEGQDLYDLLDEDRPAAPEQTHAAADFEQQLHDQAWQGEEEDMAEGAQKKPHIEQAKQQLAQALQVLKAQAPVVEQLKQTAPAVYQAMMGLSQAVVGLAKELTPPPKDKAMAKSEPRCEVCGSEYAGKNDDDHVFCKAHGPEDLARMKKDELAKVKLPMPNANAHHDVVLPAGSQVDDKLKVTHQDGHTSWKQMAAGQIRSMDPAGHPTSSRSPNSK